MDKEAEIRIVSHQINQTRDHLMEVHDELNRLLAERHSLLRQIETGLCNPKPEQKEEQK